MKWIRRNCMISGDKTIPVSMCVAILCYQTTPSVDKHDNAVITRNVILFGLVLKRVGMTFMAHGKKQRIQYPPSAFSRFYTKVKLLVLTVNTRFYFSMNLTHRF